MADASFENFQKYEVFDAAKDKVRTVKKDIEINTTSALVEHYTLFDINTLKSALFNYEDSLKILERDRYNYEKHIAIIKRVISRKLF